MTAKELIARAEQEDVSLGALSLEIESEHGGNLETSLKKFETMLQVMEAEVENALSSPVCSVSGLTGGDGYLYEKYRTAGLSLQGEIPSLATAYALSASETNAAMGRIVACPTAGSCGIVPACVLAVARICRIPRPRILYALACAGLVGMLIDEHASLAGAEGGCQAECGSAAAMAAAAVTEMMGGRPEASFHAAAMAIKNQLGLVCDQVAGLVEIPCIKRNVGGVSIALSSADMALAGIKSRIPFDDAVEAMNRVGHALPAALRETALGGLATTEAGKAMKEKVFGK